jgi:hypothetical protein
VSRKNDETRHVDRKIATLSEMRRREPFVVTAGFLVGALLACSSFRASPAAEQPDDSSPKDSAASQIDGAPRSDGGASARSDSGSLNGRCPLPNLLQNGDFENGPDPWDTNGGVASLVPRQDAGGATMQICSTAGYFALKQNKTVTAGKPVFGRVWLYSKDTSKLSEVDNSVKFGKNGKAVPLKFQRLNYNEWTCFGGPASWNPDAGDMTEYYIGATNIPVDGGNACISVDNAELFIVPDGGVPDECRCPL